MAGSPFDWNVFLNCPLDREYEPILQAILFCLVRFGLTPRIATERNDAGEARIDKLVELIGASRYSIHDLSRCQAREAGEHYRLNMPFELGIDFGCRRYGGHPFSEKVILVLEEQPYRYQAAMSDLAGMDVEAHGGDSETAVRKVRNWLTGLGGFEPCRCRPRSGGVRGLPGVVLRAPARGRFFRRRHPGLFHRGAPGGDVRLE